MNINNQPSFGARFRWDSPEMAQKVSNNCLKKGFDYISATAQSLKNVGGDNIEQVLLPSSKFIESNYDPKLVDNVFSYSLGTVLKKVDGTEIKIKSRDGDFCVEQGQLNLDALLVAEKHNLSQQQINGFQYPEEIVRYGRALDLEG